MPGFDGVQDIGRNPKGGVDLAVLGLGRRGFADCQKSAVFIFGQNDSDDLVCGELLANGPPGGVNSGLQEPMLDGGEQMIGQHAKEDVSLCPILQMMENGPLHQWTFNVAEGVFHSSEQNIGAPNFIGRQILSISLENVTAVEFLGDRLFVREFFPRQVFIGGIVGDLVITSDARITLLQSADRPLNFVFLFQPALGDALLKVLQIGDQFGFLLFSNGARSLSFRPSLRHRM